MRSYCQNHISDYAPHGECRDCDVQRENEEELEERFAARLDVLKRKIRAAEDYLVPALLRYADTEYNSRTDADATIQWRADKALQAYNDVTE